ncbi:MAG: hypothetical protein U5M23_02970 [Marinagarivorans sp.]|nr:hypothetical protein [Marinagarivorans sp.]
MLAMSHVCAQMPGSEVRSKRGFLAFSANRRSPKAARKHGLNWASYAIDTGGIFCLTAAAAMLAPAISV